MTALHLAAGGGHLDTVCLLLERGADTGAEDDLFHSTPRGWAQHDGHSEVAALLA